MHRFSLLSETQLLCLYVPIDVDWLNAHFLLINKKREREKKKPRLIELQNGGSSSDPLGPIRLPQPSVVESILIQRGAPRYCGSAHTSWEQTELPQDTVKKKHQYFIKLLSLSGPDQSLDSHSPIGREDSFVFAPQVEQQSDSLRFWKPCNAQPIHLTPRCLAFGGGSKRKSRDCEGENMFQRCPEIELLGLVVLCYVSPCFSPGRPVVSLIVKTNMGCCDLSLKDSDSISLYQYLHHYHYHQLHCYFLTRAASCDSAHPKLMSAIKVQPRPIGLCSLISYSQIKQLHTVHVCSFTLP